MRDYRNEKTARFKTIVVTFIVFAVMAALTVVGCSKGQNNGGDGHTPKSVTSVSGKESDEIIISSFEGHSSESRTSSMNDDSSFEGSSSTGENTSDEYSSTGEDLTGSDDSSVGDAASSSSGKQFGIPSNGGYYSGN